MAQPVIPAAQLVPRFHTIERCNNYAVLLSIPCSPECKIVGKILLDHPLSYALTTTTDVSIVYLQQFWRTVNILHLPVETPKNPFVAPVNIKTVEAFMNRVGYQCVVDKTEINNLQLFHVVINRTNVDYVAILWWDFMNNVRQKKEAIQYPRFIMLILADLMKKFPEIPQMIEEDYYSIKDDIPLIRATDDFKEYETVFMNVYVPMNQPERDEIAEATLLSLTLHKTALAAEAQENIAKLKEKLAEEEIEKMVEGDEDKESYESEFADSVLNDDVDDSCTRLEPGSHKENPKKVVDDDVEIEKEKKDDIEIEKEKKDDVVKEKDIVDDLTGSMEIRKEQKQTSIPSPTRSPRNVSSSDKTVFKELTATVSPITATTSKDSSTKKRKKRSFSHKTKTLPGNIAGMCRRRINKDHEVDPINAQEMIAKEFATHGPKMIEELFRKHMHNTTLNLYPTTSTSTAGKSSADLQHQLYLNMKSKPQDQAADPEIWEILKAKFEKQ
ncbi:hypothetical protein Tco_1099141 [Tanacetum coccineum]